MKRLFVLLLALFVSVSCALTPAYAEDGLRIERITTDRLVLSQGLSDLYWPYFPIKAHVTPGDVAEVRQLLDWVSWHLEQSRLCLESGEYEDAKNNLSVLDGFIEAAVRQLVIDKPSMDGLEVRRWPE